MCQLGTQHHAWILDQLGVCPWLISILELGDGCHPCELQCTSSQPVSSFMYPQGRSVHVPTGNPTPCADPGPAGGVSTANKYSRAWRWMPSL